MHSYDDMELIDTTIGECLEDRAKKMPDNIFIRLNNEVFTWECVNNITDKVALIFMEQGIRKGDKVGIYGVNSASWIISFLALQKLGAVAVLINSCYKEKELLNCIEIADIKFLFYTSPCEGDTYEKTISKLRKERKAKHVKIFNIEHTYLEWIDIVSREIKTNKKLPEKIDCKSLACILFTSGTTNNCKGVMLTHHSIVNNAREVVRQMRWTDEDIMCLVVPLFHCFGVTVSLVSSLIAGITITVLDRYKTLNVCESIEKHKCTILNGVPSMFLALVKNPKTKNYDLSSLKSGIIAGSPIFRKDYLEICNTLKSMKLQTSYGLTEASPCVSISQYDDSLEQKAISAGKIISNIEVKIINNDTKKECKTNEVGEIYVKGYNVTKGYLSSDPVVCDAVQSDGWLRTGDLAYKDENDYLYISGRRKNLIIRGGENISPYEIEKFIKEVKTGIEVVVLGVSSEVLQEEIIACIQGREDDNLEQKIREYLKENISRYKIPKYFLFIEKFPTNATGKVNEKKLKEIVNEKLKYMSLIS